MNPPTSINGETAGEGEELDGEEREDGEYLRDIDVRLMMNPNHDKSFISQQQQQPHQVYTGSFRR